MELLHVSQSNMRFIRIVEERESELGQNLCLLPNFASSSNQQQDEEREQRRVRPYLQSLKLLAMTMCVHLPTFL